MLGYEQVFTDRANHTLSTHRELLHRIAPDVAGAFYDALMADDQARGFLSENLVQERLLASQTQWLRQVFQPHGPQQKATFIQQQKQVGKVHARIGLPLALMTLGTRIHKHTLLKKIFENIEDTDEALNLYITLLDILDYTTGLINEAYMQYEQAIESENQLFTITYAGSELAFEILTVKSDLQTWLIDTLASPDAQKCRDSLAHIQDTQFWLWIEYRLSQFKGSFRAVELVLEALQKLEAFVNQCNCDMDDTGWRHELKRRVTKLAHSLQLLSEEVMEENHNRDPLTKLLNRRLLDAVLKKEHHIARVHNGDYAVLMVDIDHFKQINDTYGHAVGDAVLKTVAGVIRQNLRITDLAFRYGGEEFVILVPLARDADAVAIAEKLRRAVEQTTDFSTEHAELRLTISIGVSQYSLHPHPDYIHVLKQADRALYQAKRAGRNRVVLWQGELI